ncbi:hypothetical protein DCAR_0209632 [Daucus carota subsp. sativus]|uniref:GDT1 family protein n=1 Tax=Daucus carota subsp. sativus TaxID=79200 RepID=A0AAF1APJ0_DAUCS|nr:hypothetical protein DCAR_0209632 [Daucus carota subsp. sativus]
MHQHSTLQYHQLNFAVYQSLSTRYLRICRNNMHDGKFGHFLCKVPDHLHITESTVTNSSSHNATKLIHDMNGCASDNIASEMNSWREISSSLHYFVAYLYFKPLDRQLLLPILTVDYNQIHFLGTSATLPQAFLLIFFSELGDKTFFIAALLAARNSSVIVFLGTFGALGVMTVISVVLGRTFHYVDEILPFRFGDSDLPLDDIAAVLLLVYFGVSTLLDAASGDGMKADEEQKEAELAVSDFSGDGAGILAAAGTIVSTFVLVFVAEWGDKSFFSTIALAAASSPLGVIGGALAGHGSATLLAVLGGSLLGTFLSEKVIAYVGGSLFLVFAAVTLIEIVHP